MGKNNTNDFYHKSLVYVELSQSMLLVAKFPQAACEEGGGSEIHGLYESEAMLSIVGISSA